MIAEKQYGNKSYAGSYNVGPDDCDCVTTGELADIFCQCWGDGQTWINRSVSGPHEANFLKLDCSRLKKTFGWKPGWHVKEAVARTVEWARVYLEGQDVSSCMDRQIGDFLQRQ